MPILLDILFVVVVDSQDDKEDVDRDGSVFIVAG